MKRNLESSSILGDDHFVDVSLNVLKNKGFAKNVSDTNDAYFYVKYDSEIKELMC